VASLVTLSVLLTMPDTPFGLRVGTGAAVLAIDTQADVPGVGGCRDRLAFYDRRCLDGNMRIEFLTIEHRPGGRAAVAAPSSMIAR